ncbi:MAG: Rossmann-like domain-containing protein [Coriobacteriia bacterium]
MLMATVAEVRTRLGRRLDDITVERAVIGLFFTGVKLSTQQGGLCFTPIKAIPQAVCCPSSAREMPLSGSLAGRKAEAFLEDISSGSILKRTLGIAVLNALSALIWDEMAEKPYVFELGRDAFDLYEESPLAGKTVVVGALAPMLRRLRAAGADFHVLEQDPSTLKPYEMPFYLPAERAVDVVPQADRLIITGTTVLNGTLGDLLGMARPGAEIVVAGPTASMLPEAFFAQGVDVLGGVYVTKPDALLDVIAEAGSGYHFFGKSAERLMIRAR